MSSTPKPLTQFESDGMQLQLVQELEGLDIIWGLKLLSETELLLTQKRGGLKKFNLKTRELVDIKGAPQKVYFGGQAAFFDIELHPQFQKNSWIYFSYATEKDGKRTTEIARGKLLGNEIKDLKPIFTAQPFYSESHHFGGRITFDDQGFLFIAVGDRGNRDLAQDLSRHNGKIIRIHDDGRAPKDNPFVSQENARPEIWSYGHRNPQGLVFDAPSKKLWSHEHGPRGGDEINLIQKGVNYGWPIITYGKEYWGPVSIGEGTSKPGMQQPVYYYVPSIAPCGYLVYRGKMFDAWRGQHFLGALARQHINRVKIENSKFVSENRLLESLGERVRELELGPEGEILFSTDSGKLMSLRRLKQ